MMEEGEEARRALLNIQQEIRRDIAKEKELQEARSNPLHFHSVTINFLLSYNCLSNGAK